MSKVTSYRFNERTLRMMEVLANSLEINEKELIENAINNYFEKWENDYNADIVTVDFQKNFEGVNSTIVDHFITEVTEKTQFKLYKYCDGDQVQFLYEEEI